MTAKRLRQTSGCQTRPVVRATDDKGFVSFTILLILVQRRRVGRACESHHAVAGGTRKLGPPCSFGSISVASQKSLYSTAVTLFAAIMNGPVRNASAR